jgi:serine/threonine-protein kinase HipA
MMAALSVALNQVPVGVLETLDDYYYRFSFDHEWLRDPQRPVLGQLFEDRRPHDIITSGLPCWFAHLLPQGPLRRLIARSTGVDSTEDFEVLTACGGDLPGAVILSETATTLARRDRPVIEQAEPFDTLRLGFALAGNQWKLSVREGERGLVVPTKGQDAAWIAKFHDPEYPRLPRVEYATTLLARRCGLSVPEVKLVDATDFERLPEELPLGDGSVFLTQRFDRHGEHRIHMEDLAQILDRPPGQQIYLGTHEEIAAVLHNLHPEGLDRYIEQVVFNVVIGNGDAHLKNWSMLYPDGRTPELSPAYDLVPTIVYIRREKLALGLGGTWLFDQLIPQRFSPLAREIGLGEEELQGRAVELVERYAGECLAGLEEVGFDEREQKILKAHIEKIVRQFSRVS